METWKTAKSSSQVQFFLLMWKQLTLLVIVCVVTLLSVILAAGNVWTLRAQTRAGRFGRHTVWHATWLASGGEHSQWGQVEGRRQRQTDQLVLRIFCVLVFWLLTVFHWESFSWVTCQEHFDGVHTCCGTFNEAVLPQYQHSLLPHSKYFKCVASLSFVLKLIHLDGCHAFLMSEHGWAQAIDNVRTSLTKTIWERNNDPVFDVLSYLYYYCLHSQLAVLLFR